MLSLDSAWNVSTQQQSIPQGSLLQATGWAADNEDGSPVAQVVLLVDDAVFAQANLGLSRPDVANFFNRPAYANSGWTLTASTASLSVGTHSAIAQAYDSSGNTSPSNAIQFTVTMDSPPEINIDGSGVFGVATGNTTVPQGGLINAGGWAVDAEDGAPIAKIKVLLDGESIGDATLGGSRPDVAQVFGRPDWTNSGWNFTGSVHQASVGTHMIQAAAYDKSGNETLSVATSITVTATSDTWAGTADIPINPSGAAKFALNGAINMSGWAVEPDANPGAPLSRVEIEIDGQTLGTATLGGSRPDVASFFGRSDYTNSGWTFSGHLTGVGPGAHVVDARAYTQSGASFLINGNYNIVIQGNMMGTSATGQPASYAYALGHAQNGNILNASDSVNSDWSYGYDSLNRLTSAQSSNSGASWSYDSFGNRTAQTALSGNVLESAFSFSAGTNHADQFCYDAAGNMLDQVPCGYSQVHEFAYDAEGKLISSGFGSTSYIYDADGNRVAKQSFGTNTNIYFYDVAGHMTVETDGSGGLRREELFAGDRHLATIQNNKIIYAHANWLGTESARSDSSGNLCETLAGLPFGDGLQFSGSCDPSTNFFTGKERDSESGLDYFGARYYGSSMGRFMSPDWSAKQEPVPYSKLDNPQSLNLYSYTLNNPLSNIDTDGHACSGILGNTGSGFCTRATEYGMIDGIAAVRSQTRFFAAASAVSSALADVNAPGSSMVSGVSGQTASFLEGVGQKLQAFNEGEAHLIASGNLSGPGRRKDLSTLPCTASRTGSSLMNWSISHGLD